MNYSNVINGAWKITKSSKAMWFIGMFVVASGSFNWGQGVGNLLGEAIDPDFDITSYEIERWFEEYWWVVLLGIVVILMIALIAWLLNYIATAGLLAGANQARLGNKPRFGWMFTTGLRQGWKVFVIDLLLGLIVMGLMLAAVISMLCMILTIIGILFVPFLLLVMIIAILPLAAAVLAVRLYALQYAVLHNQPIILSLQKAWSLLKVHVVESAAMYGLNMLLKIVVGLAMLLVALLVLLPFAILGFVAYSTFGWLAVTLIIAVASIILGCLLLILRGVSNTYIYSLWHLGFTELTLGRSSSAVEQ